MPKQFLNAPDLPFHSQKTTAPVPIKTSINVPMTSATNFFIIKFLSSNCCLVYQKIHSYLKKCAQSILLSEKKPSGDDFFIFKWRFYPFQVHVNALNNFNENNNQERTNHNCQPLCQAQVRHMEEFVKSRDNDGRHQENKGNWN